MGPNGSLCSASLYTYCSLQGLKTARHFFSQYNSQKIEYTTNRLETMYVRPTYARPIFWVDTQTPIFLRWGFYYHVNTLMWWFLVLFVPEGSPMIRKIREERDGCWIEKKKTLIWLWCLRLGDHTKI